jgi:hypothetical protein
MISSRTAKLHINDGCSVQPALGLNSIAEHVHSMAALAQAFINCPCACALPRVVSEASAIHERLTGRARDCS